MRLAFTLSSDPRSGSRRHWLALALAGLGSLGALGAMAQSYPSKPIRLIIPYSTGTTTDVFARLYALKLGEQLGQSIIPDNRVGAGGNIAVNAGRLAGSRSIEATDQPPGPHRRSETGITDAV